MNNEHNKFPQTLIIIITSIKKITEHNSKLILHFLSEFSETNDWNAMKVVVFLNKKTNNI